MTIYNPNDFSPSAGQKIKSDGTVVNPADSVDTAGNQGVSINKRQQTTIQTHTAQSIATNGSGFGNYVSTWMDCNGFDQLAFTGTIEASASWSVNVLWSNDNAIQHGFESLLSASTSTARAGIIPIKSRYAKIQITNGDATNPHTFNGWVFLKA